MARIQNHHIKYKPHEWIIELGMMQHRTISRIQQTKATPLAYAEITNFMHAVSVEWNRMREELDMEKDLRNLKPPEMKKDKKKPKAKVKAKPKRKIKRRKKDASKNDPGVHKGKRNSRTAGSKAVTTNTNRRRA